MPSHPHADTVSSQAQPHAVLLPQSPLVSSRAQPRDLLFIKQSPQHLIHSVSSLKRFFRLLLATLREIGDENAYHRHLAAHGLQHSGREWRRFCDERWLAASKRAKCC